MTQTGCLFSVPTFREEIGRGRASESGTLGVMSGVPAVAVKRNAVYVYWGLFLNVLARCVALLQRSLRTNRRRASRRSLLPTDRFLRSSQGEFTFP